MGIVICIIIAIIVLIVWAHEKGKPSKLAAFIRDNPARASIYLVQDGSVLADFNSDRVMPLASTVKIIIAIEYARQAASGRINPDEMIDTKELGKYYIANTDGGAHPKWLKQMHKKGLVNNGKVRLEEIAKGMIRFSSNANTEYLMEILGLDNINSNLASLGLERHQALYPFVSSLLIYKEVTEEDLEQMPMEAYRDFSYAIHNGLRANEFAYKDSLRKIPRGIQKIWSDRLPGSTAKEYVSILQKINSRTWFDAATQKNIDTLMEGMMDSPKNKSWFYHAGMKGGSTAFVLTMALYATAKNGGKTELAYFFNNLTYSENILWQTVLNNFHRAILKDKKKREELLAIINAP